MAQPLGDIEGQPGAFGDTVCDRFKKRACVVVGIAQQLDRLDRDAQGVGFSLDHRPRLVLRLGREQEVDLLGTLFLGQQFPQAEGRKATRLANAVQEIRILALRRTNAYRGEQDVFGRWRHVPD